MNLSKTRYCNGVQCPKMLWMAHHMPEQFDGSVMDTSMMEMGNRVGDLAMNYFGDFVEVPYCADHSLMIAETRRLLEAGAPVITEASFAHDGSFCSVDILRVFADGVEIVEVKSATGLHKNYLDDMAYQCHVVASCGLQVRRVCLLCLNSEYVRYGELELSRLFSLIDCSDKIFAMQSAVQQQIPLLKQIADQADEPELDIGERCDNPYTCGYKGYCWRHVPAYSVFEINRLGVAKKWELYHKGIKTFADVLERGVRLSEKQRRQVEAQVRQSQPILDRDAIRSFLASLCYPLYFLDFETYKQAVPEFDGVSPYMQIPSQYSLHSIAYEGAELIHHEFLADAGTDPRRALAESLCRDIPSNVCALAYNMSFEKGVIENLVQQFPDLADHLVNIHDSIRDLMIPFQNQYYYCREMQGSYSIKYVLPALFPNDPELDYHALDGIGNGSQAMNAFASLAGKAPDEAAEIRRSLLAYCRLDTYAMVKIWEKLREAAE